MKEIIVEEDRGTSEKKIPDSGVTDRFAPNRGASIARQTRLTRFKSGWRAEMTGCI